MILEAAFDAKNNGPHFASAAHAYQDGYARATYQPTETPRTGRVDNHSVPVASGPGYMFREVFI